MKPDITKILLFGLLIVTCFAVLFISINNDLTRRSLQDNSDIVADYFTVKEYNGKVAIYKNDEIKPYVVYDAYVSLLPQQDIDLLKKGIVTDDKEYLQKVIEDYTS